MYWRLYYLIQTSHPWLELCTDVRFFKVSPRDVFDTNSLVDIGHEIRCMVMQNSSRSTLFDLIEYSLPYVKHNRLHLPNYDRIDFSVLCQIAQIMLATCIGTFSHSTRRPVWDCRVRLLAFFDDMLSNRTKQDLWEFCNDNILVMRISLIEYFVYFVKNQMPAEHENMRMSFENSLSMTHMFDNIIFTLNMFRQNAFCEPTFTWKQVNSLASICIEKCNRMCKGKQRKRRPQRTLKRLDASHDLIKSALLQPMFAHVEYVMDRPSDFVRNALMYKIHRLIHVYALPHNLAVQQKQIAQHSIIQGKMRSLQYMFMNVCLACPLDTAHPDTQMRVHNSTSVACERCHRSDTVVNVNMLGRLLNIHGTYYYYCPFCRSVKKWTGSGCEFRQCVHASGACARRINTNCIFCNRNNTEIMRVLDDELGLMQTLHLCKSHMPLEHQLPYIYNFETFLLALSHKKTLGSRRRV